MGSSCIPPLASDMDIGQRFRTVVGRKGTIVGSTCMAYRIHRIVVVGHVVEQEIAEELLEIDNQYRKEQHKQSVLAEQLGIQKLVVVAEDVVVGLVDLEELEEHQTVERNQGKIDCQTYQGKSNQIGFGTCSTVVLELEQRQQQQQIVGLVVERIVGLVVVGNSSEMQDFVERPFLQSRIGCWQYRWRQQLHRCCPLVGIQGQILGLGKRVAVVVAVVVVLVVVELVQMLLL